MYNILLDIVWWVLSNASLIMGIYSVVSEIIANKTCSYWWSDISVMLWLKTLRVGLWGSLVLGNTRELNKELFTK